MRRIFVKELSAYTCAEFALKLGVTEERADTCIKVLSAHGVLRLRSGNEPSEYDVEPAGSLNGKYQFAFVGLTIFEDIVLVVYPKYMDDRRFAGDVADETVDALRRIFHVLRKSSGSYSDIAALDEGARRFNDRVALILMLLEMYADWGVYSNYVRTLKTNGNGDISWERTIAMHQPYLSDGVPVYFDYETISNAQDDADFVTRLHRCVLTECSTYLRESGLAEMLGFDDAYLSDECMADIGDVEYICRRLDQERAVQYVTWKQEVIDLLKRYVSEDKAAVYSDEVVCLGSTAFHAVWEKACKVAFGDLLDKRLDRTGVKLAGSWRKEKGETLLDIVPSPRWSWYDAGGEHACGDVATLIPDVVAVWGSNAGDGVGADGGGDAGTGVSASAGATGTFAILDAKYYTPHMGLSPKGMPGVESVTKQILYQRAYREFVVDHGFGRVVNAFLVPSDGDEFALMGHVRFPGVFDAEEPPFVDGVDMWKVPAERVWQCYLSGKALGDAELRGVFEG